MVASEKKRQRDVQEREHVIPSGLHDRHGGGELFAQHLGDPLPVGSHLIWCLDDEHCLWSPADCVYMRQVRDRWSIENAWHWPRDTQLKEDAHRYLEPNGVQLIANLRSLA